MSQYPSKTEFVQQTTRFRRRGQVQQKARNSAARHFGFVDFDDLRSRAKNDGAW
ncbi:hypothetical protein [Photobacterium sp. OFAV2-7]|uniref:hypothetical protein n=1 Tax=Photobacterium sp. OFAV2-7 TaxID=2917748 RepID=UPI001EF44EA4|nr:hypothetical protein [Photobacterium sp. OFAV2-7]MCG7586853.1 hypothetical protein [Photobacterium sp. OFAV2-7]